MVEKKVQIKNATGLYLKPAGELCKAAMLFECSVKFSLGNTTANAKSVLSVLGACVRGGDEILLRCEGPDEAEALEYLSAKIEAGLEE